MVAASVKTMSVYVSTFRIQPQSSEPGTCPASDLYRIVPPLVLVSAFHATAFGCSNLASGTRNKFSNAPQNRMTSP